MAILCTFPQEADPKPAIPRDLSLSTHIYRWTRLQAESAVLALRDFDLPLLEVHDFRVWGPMLVAEEEATEQERYSQTMPTAFADGPWKVLRSLKSLKVYSDLSFSCLSLSACLGPCLDPVLGQVTIALSYLLGRRSRDPSLPLPWWDKLRFFLHGRASAHLQSCTFCFLTTMDPYNTGERVELFCHRFDVSLNQTEEIGLDCTDLDLRIRTTSEYEDCTPLHVPRLRLRLVLIWQTLGGSDPRQHFAVRLTNQRSSHKRTDSYAEFRSTGFEMNVGVKTFEGPDVSAPEDGGDEYVAVEMLSSTVKWVEELLRSSVLSSTSPPIRKGRLFGCDEGWKKKTLFRHLSRVRVETFSIHRLELNYWTSILHAEGIQARVEEGFDFKASYFSRRRAMPKESLIRR